MVASNQRQAPAASRIRSVAEDSPPSHHVVEQRGRRRAVLRMHEVAQVLGHHVDRVVAEGAAQGRRGVEHLTERVEHDHEVAGALREREEEVLLLLAALLHVAQRGEVVQVGDHPERRTVDVAQGARVGEHLDRPARRVADHPLDLHPVDGTGEQPGDEDRGLAALGPVAEVAHVPPDEPLHRAAHQLAEGAVGVEQATAEVEGGLRDRGLLEAGLAERDAALGQHPAGLVEADGGEADRPAVLVTGQGPGDPHVDPAVAGGPHLGQLAAAAAGGRLVEHVARGLGVGVHGGEVVQVAAEEVLAGPVQEGGEVVVDLEELAVETDDHHRHRRAEDRHVRGCVSERIRRHVSPTPLRAEALPGPFPHSGRVRTGNVRQIGRRNPLNGG